MKELVRYLLENITIDFQGDVNLETVREFLRRDDSHEARVLTEGGSLARIALDGQVYTLRITRQGKLIPTK